MLYSDLRTFIDNSVPGTAANYTTLRDQGISLAISQASPRFRELTYAEFTAPDAITTRYALTGRDVKIVEEPEEPVVTSLNTSGVAAPTTAPTLTAVSSGGSLTAGLYYWGYCYVTVRGDTEMSPLQSVQVVASGKITRAAITVPTNVTGIKDFLSSTPGSADVHLNGSAVNAVSSVVPSLTLSSAPASSTARPFINHTPLTSYFTSGTSLARLEPGVDVDGTSNSAVTTITLDTAPAAGDRFRIWYTRRPIQPSAGTDTINLPDEWLKNASLFYTCSLLTLAHQSGDTTRFLSVANLLQPLVQDLEQQGSGRIAPTIIASTWAA